MAYRRIGGGGGRDEDGRLIFSMSEVGTAIEGTYKSVREIKGYEGKGKQKCYTFDLLHGEEEEIVGFGLMDHIMQNVEKGSQVRITYTGKPGKYHQCTVEVDDGEANAENIDEEGVPF